MLMGAGRTAHERAQTRARKYACTEMGRKTGGEEGEGGMKEHRGLSLDAFPANTRVSCQK